MTTKKIDMKALAAKAAELKDQTQTTTGGGSYEPPPAGKTVGRFIEYVELGKHKKEYKGKAKPDTDQVRMVFELLGPKHQKEIEVNGVKKTIANRITITKPMLFNTKADFAKLMKAMVYGRDDIKHMSQMLGEAFRLEVFHSEPNTEGKIFAGLKPDQDSDYAIGIPAIEKVDEEGNLTGEFQRVKVPEALSPLRIFLWDLASKDQWDSLYIEGTKEVTKDGKKVQQSNNYIQDQIKSAVNFKGSPIFNILSGVDDLAEFAEGEGEEVELEETEVEEVEEVEEVVAPKAAAKKPVTKPTATAKATSQPATATPKAKTTTAPTASKAATKVATATAKPAAKVAAKKAAPAADDDLAALGLVPDGE